MLPVVTVMVPMRAVTMTPVFVVAVIMHRGVITNPGIIVHGLRIIHRARRIIDGSRGAVSPAVVTRRANGNPHTP
jgi:hypothetical protein